MRQIVSSSEVAHLWANKVQSYASVQARNFYFEDNTIYSYGSHFPIAKHVTNERGSSAVLFTKQTYSTTTAKHVGIVGHSCRHLKRIYVWGVNDSVERNFGAWKQELESILEKYNKARKPELYIQQANIVWEQIEKYSTFFDYNIPEYLIELHSVFLGEMTTEEYNRRIEEHNRMVREAAEKAREKEEKERIKKFNTFKTNHFYSDYQIVRFNKKSERFETSLGVEMPVLLAEKFYFMLINGELEVGQKLLHYTILHISKNDIQIGCHKFKISYLKKVGAKHFAKQLAA